ncbi:MAG TPA: cytochrome c maturation protein CcmE [Acidimicrobiales bacterium]
MDVTPPPGASSDSSDSRAPDAAPDGPGALNLTPRATQVASRPDRRKRKWGPILVLVAILGVAGYVAAQALTTATTFFYNADEAVANQQKLGTSRFRLQGTVEPGTINRTETGVAFTVTFNGAEVAVVHQGDPPELFRDAMPVVLEGHWDSSAPRFDSDRMLVKHDATYTAKNGERLKEADQGGTVPPTTAAPGAGSGTPTPSVAP